MDDGTWMRAWHPAVPGVREVLHARMIDHAYPAHAHADWALMLVDEGAVAYELGGRARIADGAVATLLPPGVAHDGRAAQRSVGFRKRVAYLDASWMSEALAGGVVDQPSRADLLAGTRRLHRALAQPGAELAAEEALMTLSDRFAVGLPADRRALRDDALARRLLLHGAPPATVAADAGFHDQAHLTRHFRAVLGATPARFARAR